MIFEQHYTYSAATRKIQLNTYWSYKRIQRLVNGQELMMRIQQKI